ncbi:MAG: type II toxin-antitoxin system VapC family toxin [Treponema sp.]|nr:type II toxin-antitoxin system VapC family toxin [Treponema sp.]
MKYLLDTHTILWYLTDDNNLSVNARSIIDSSDCFYSKISLWEIAIKQSLGKLHYKNSIDEISEFCKLEGFLQLNVLENHMEHLKTLEFIHRDPFDRLLISCAQCEDLTIITRDSTIPKYDVKTVW